MIRRMFILAGIALVGCSSPAPAGPPAPAQLDGPYTGSFENAPAAPQAAPVLQDGPQAPGWSEERAWPEARPFPAPVTQTQPRGRDANGLPPPTVTRHGAPVPTPQARRPASGAGAQAARGGPADARRAATPASRAFTFRFQVGDELAMDVWKEPELSTKQRVLPDGTFAPPLLGVMRAQGLTLDELRAALAARYRAYIKDPKVSVRVEGIYSDRVFVLGEVEDAQAVSLRGPTTVLQAIAQAGGFREGDAEKGVIRLVRRGRRGEALVYNVNANAVLCGRRADPPVQRGDIVYVTSTGATNWQRTVGKILEPIATGLGTLGVVAGTTAAIISLD